MAVPSLDSLNMSDERKNYIIQVFNPAFEEFVIAVLTNLPKDPIAAMLEFAQGKKGGPSSDISKLQQENEKLKQQISELSKTNQTNEKKAEESEEEDDATDELTEEPDALKAPASKQMRTSVSAEAYGAWNQKKAFTAPSYPKSDDQKKRLTEVLKKSFLFSALEPKEFEQVVGAMQEKDCDAKEQLIKQGDDGDFLFVIEEGKLNCLIGEKVVKTLGAGDVFGELALLYNCPRAASVENEAKAVLWKLDRDTFNAIVKDAASKKRDRYDAFLQKVPLLSSLDAYERSQVADALEHLTYTAGQEVVKENDDGNKFFIIEEGEAYAEKNGVGKVMEYKQADYFGELALLRNQPRAATVIAKGALSVLTLDRGAFKRLLGPLDDILTRSAAKYN